MKRASDIEMEKMRLEILHDMHEYIMNLGDEEIYTSWIWNCLPEDAYEEDYADCADFSMFYFVCKMFYQLVVLDTKKTYKNNSDESLV